MHDLLRIGSAAELVCDVSLPHWAHVALRRAPWVVVRRQQARAGLCAVGIRGSERVHRHPAWLETARIIELRTPESLSAPATGHGLSHSFVPRAALEILRECFREALARGAIASWGPAGSLGFELATGVTTVTAHSDLDVVVRAGQPPPLPMALGWLNAFARCNVRVDCLIELPQGGIALTEYAMDGGPMILRTSDGPRAIARSACSALGRAALV